MRYNLNSNRITISVLIVFLSLSGSSQNYLNFNQFFFNKSSINPAISGTTPNYFMQFTERLQWTSFEGAPRTTTLNADLQTGKRNGIAAQLLNDVSGAISYQQASIAYAHHFPLVKSFRNTHSVSLGVDLSVAQYHLDLDKMKFINPNEPLLPVVQIPELFMDAAFGVHYYNRKFYSGLSAKHLLQHFLQKNNYLLNNLQINFLGGYKHKFNSWIDSEFILMMRHIHRFDSHIDLGTKCYFKRNNNADMIWLGISAGAIYNQKLEAKQITMLTGSTFASNFFFTYSFEYSPSSVFYYSYGTHLFSIGFFISKQNKKCPAFL